MFYRSVYGGGLFVSQDDYNYEGKQHMPQNFRLVKWEEVERLIEDGL